MRYHDDEVYHGYFKNGEPSGFGTLVTKGYTFKGMFEHGLPNGKGYKIFDSGKEV